MSQTAGTNDRSEQLLPVAGPQFWRGPEMAGKPDEWTHVLTAAERDDLDAAVQAVRGRKLEILEISRDDFPLPVLGPTLARLRKDLLEGRGFTLIRGVPVDRYSIEESAIAFWGLGAHLGVPVSQNGKGHVLGHVKDLGLDYADPLARGYQTHARLPYHTDYSDLVCLLCLKPSKSGGLSSIVSSVTLYNEILQRRPDLAEALTRPVCRTRWGEAGPDRKPWMEVPVFNLHSQGVVTTYVRSSVRKAQLMPEVPRLSEVQNEAMDLLDTLAGDPAFHLDMDFRPGDVQILNNHWIMHSRTAYEDAEDWDDKRHLLRLWLACADGPTFPPAMSENFEGLTKNGRPNGIHIAGVPFSAPLDAC
jgi:hypothetical protein